MTCRPSDHSVVRPPRPGRDSNPGRADLVAGTLTTAVTIAPHLPHPQLFISSCSFSFPSHSSSSSPFHSILSLHFLHLLMLFTLFLLILPMYIPSLQFFLHLIILCILFLYNSIYLSNFSSTFSFYLSSILPVESIVLFRLLLIRAFFNLYVQHLFYDFFLLFYSSPFLHPLSNPYSFSTYLFTFNFFIPHPIYPIIPYLSFPLIYLLYLRAISPLLILPTLPYFQLIFILFLVILYFRFFYTVLYFYFT